MRYRRPTRHAVGLATAAVFLAGCGTDDATTDPGDEAVGPETDEAAAPDDAPADDAVTQGDEPDAPRDDEPDAPAPDPDGADDGDADETQQDAAAGDLVDIATAQPGNWPVGDAGTVTFDVVDGQLVLEDHEAAAGWEATVDDGDGDGIEVDFTQDGRRWEFEVEIDDGRLEIEIRQDHSDASAGSYDLPDGGSFAFDANGRLTLTDVSPGDGWEVVEQQEESDEVEIDLREGDRTVDVEVELDDGRIEVEIDYEVIGPLPS